MIVITIIFTLSKKKIKSKKTNKQMFQTEQTSKVALSLCTGAESRALTTQRTPLKLFNFRKTSMSSIIRFITAILSSKFCVVRILSSNQYIN